MNTYEAYQILSSFMRSTYGFYNEDKSKISRLLEINEVEEALKNIKYQLKTIHDKTFYLALIKNTSKVVVFYSSPNDFEGKRIIAVFDESDNVKRQEIFGEQSPATTEELNKKFLEKPFIGDDFKNTISN